MVKITAIPASDELDGSEIFPIVQGDQTKLGTVAALQRRLNVGVTPLVDVASLAATQAQNAAASALALGNFIPGGLAAGEAATPVGKTFSVEQPAGVLSFRVRTAGGSTELANTAQDVVTPEMFGTPGAGANDNALFLAAVATGKPVRANGPLYKLDRLALTGNPNIVFAPETEIRNVQASGTKEAAITVAGAPVGSAVAVTGFDLINAGGTVTALRVGQLSNKVRVASSSGYAVGDTIRIFESGPPINATRKGTTSVEPEDMNYREFATVDSIAGNILTLREFMRWPYTVALALKVQKIAFAERARITGGRWTGGNPGGGAVTFRYCRKGYAGDMIVSSNGDTALMGGTPVSFFDCWECQRGAISAQWTVFTHYGERNQACTYGKIIAGKRTQNGGVYISGDTYCYFDMIVQDAPGSTAGDQIGLANGARRNIFAGIGGTGSNCYTAWVRQGCDDNTFLSFASFNGITLAIQDYADRNLWRSVKVAGHPSGGVKFAGDYTQAHIDVEVEGDAVILQGAQRGLRISGRAISTGTGAGSSDLLIGANLCDSVIDLHGGKLGAKYAAGAIENHSNEIAVSGSKPYQLRSRRYRSGAPFREQHYGVSSTTPVTIKVPGFTLDGAGNPAYAVDGLIELAPEPSDDGVIYKVLLMRNQAHVGTCSQYLVLARQGVFEIMSETLPTAAIPAFRPKLRKAASDTRLQIYLDDAGSAQVLMQVERV